MYEKTFEKSLQVDQQAVKRLNSQKVNKSLEKDFPGLSNLLKVALTPLSNNYSQKRYSSSPLDTLLLNEWQKIQERLYLLNQDRVKLRDLNFQLMCTFAKGLVPRNTAQLLGGKQQVHYELLKEALNKERRVSEALNKKIQEQNQLIEKLSEESATPKNMRRSNHTSTFITPHKSSIGGVATSRNTRNKIYKPTSQTRFN